MNKEEYLTVSQMARLHHISRQTLIYYDHIGLFRPLITDDKGYRYYSYQQVNVLKEILFLKKLNLPLEVISKIVREQDAQEAISILKEQRAVIDREIDNLYQTRKYVEERLMLYETIDFDQPINVPYFLHVDERASLEVPFHEDIRDNEDELQVRFMEAIDMISAYDFVPSLGFGVVVPEASLNTDLKASSIFIFVPNDSERVKASASYRLHEAGECCCMYYYGRPSHHEQHLKQILAFIKENGYEVCNDALDICLLDHVKHEDNKDVDFCSLQIPVKRINLVGSSA